MCLIIFNPKGHAIPADWVRNGWKTNPHGAGIMWVSNGIVHHIKGLMSLADTLTALESITQADYLAVHLRYATHGGNGKDLTHPFAVDKGGYLMHNGILDCGKIPEGHSDTSHLAAMLVSMPGWLETGLAKLVDSYTRGSRMLYMYPTEWRTTGNWEEVDGLFCSNNGYEDWTRGNADTVGYNIDYTLNPFDFGLDDDLDGETLSNLVDRLESELGAFVTVSLTEETTQDDEFYDLIYEELNKLCSVESLDVIA